ncbi:MAG TPA: carboxypeptidase-like regulatory domain-containing protein [Thermoanaerobaculia bacterium]|jgi:nitrogen fixation protein FixH
MSLLPILAVLMVAGAPAEGHVVVAPVNDAASRCTGVLRAETIGADGEAARTAQVLERGAKLALAAGADWRVTLDSPDCWAAPLVVDAVADDTTAVLRVWPKAVLRGELKTRPGIRPPAALRAVIQSPPGSAAVDTTETSCTVDGNTWTCAVPATSLDVRLVASGFAPVYLWDVTPEGARSLGAILFEQGGSVAGWVSRNTPSAEPIAVELSPSVHGGDEATRRRLQTRVLSARATARGFFQIVGVPAGVFTLAAHAKDASPARLEELRVREAQETVLEDPLLLMPLAVLETRLTPATPAPEQRWRVELDRFTTRGTGRERVTSGAATATGEWSAKGLERGRYRLAVVASGSVVAAREVDIRTDLEHVTIAVGEVPVRGTVLVGTQPVEGRLNFDSRGRSIVLHSNAQGEFAGAVPEEGQWRVRVTPKSGLQQVRTHADVHRREGEEVATVDVVLPGGRIEGKVVDEFGSAIAGADVVVLRGTEFEANAASADDGSFTLYGLRPGEMSVRARTARAESERVAVTVRESGATETTLTVRPPSTVRVLVRRTDGLPVVGAMIRAFAQGRLREYVTGPSGSFMAEVPAGSSTLDVAIVAPGLPLKLERISLHDDPAEIRIDPSAGELAIVLAGAPPWPFVRRGDMALPLPFLFSPASQPGPAREFRDGAFRLALEPGEYQVCAGPAPGNRCITARVTPGGIVRIDGSSLWPSAK